MLISVSGSQGCGKTTLIKQFADAGFKIVQRKTSRSILLDWNVTLEEVNTNLDLTIQFQNEILKRKCDDEYEASVSPDIWFTERTPIDLLVYSTITLGMNNKFSDWLDEYAKNCIDTTNQMYHHVVYLPAGHFSVEKDGVRGHNKFYSTMVDATMERFYNYYLPSPLLTVVDTPSLGDRISRIYDLLEFKSDSKKYD